MVEKPCVFLELDGVVVEYNEAPGIQPDMLIPKTVETLQQWQDLGVPLILLTHRTPEDSQDLLSKLATEANILFDRVLFGLPKSPRILVGAIDIGEHLRDGYSCKAFQCRLNEGVPSRILSY